MVIYTETIAPSAHGQPLVVMPMNGAPAEFYRPLARHLANRGFTVTLVTLPGFDGTEPLAAPSWSALVEALLPVVRKAFTQPGVLVGHSLGGMLALLIASKLGDELAQLVLMEPAIVPGRWAAALGSWLYRRKQVDRATTEFENRGPGFWRVHDVSRFPRAAFDAVARCSQATDLATLRALSDGYVALQPLPFKTITVPVCTIRGASSGMSQWFSQRLLAMRLPVAREVVIPKAAHWLANEQDEAIAGEIAGFCSGW